jgi:hypothetical protein
MKCCVYGPICLAISKLFHMSVKRATLTRRPTVLDLSLRSLFPVLMLNVFIVANLNLWPILKNMTIVNDTTSWSITLELSITLLELSIMLLGFSIMLLDLSFMLLELSIILLELSIMLLVNIYSIGITHDDHHMTVIICLKYRTLIQCCLLSFYLMENNNLQTKHLFFVFCLFRQLSFLEWLGQYIVCSRKWLL